MKRRSIFVLSVLLALTTASLSQMSFGAISGIRSTCDPRVLFFDDFESGPGEWQIPGSMVLTTAHAFSPNHSQTLTQLGSAGDAFSFLFPVTPGVTYYLHVAYMTLGDGGYIGVNQYDGSMSFLGEAWMIGADPTVGGVVAGGVSMWDYNSSRANPASLGVWKEYTKAFPTPSNVAFLSIKDEDWSGSSLSRDPVNHGVFYDNIEWSTSPIPSCFSASASPRSLSIGRGSSATVAVTLTSLGFSGQVNLTATIAPVTSKSPSIALSKTSLTLSSGGTATFTLTITAVHSPKGEGTYVIMVTATSGSIIHTVTTNLTVSRT